MELLGGNAHLAAQAELAAVGEAGGGVHVHRGAVHTGGKAGGGLLVGGDDGVAVVGGMGGNVGDGRVQAVHHAHRHLVIQILGVEILFTGGNTLDDGGGLRVQMQFHGGHPGGGAAFAQALFQHGQEAGGNILVHQADFRGVADAGTAGLGVLHNVQCHFQVGGLVHIDVADAGAGLDAGHGGVFHTGADQPGAAPGDQQVHQTVGGHQLVGGSMGGILDQADRRFGQTGLHQPLTQGVHDGVAGGPGVPAAAQHTGAARLDGQGGGVGCDIGAAFVDNGNDAHGHGGLFNQDAVGAHDLAQHRAHRIGQGGHFPHALGHVGQAGGGQGQAVQHHVAHPAAGRVQIPAVGFQNLFLGRHQGHGHGFQGGVFGVAVGQGQGQAGCLGVEQDLMGGHGSLPPS